MAAIINVWPSAIKSPEAYYTQLVAGLLPSLNLGTQGGGGTFYAQMCDAVSNLFTFVSTAGTNTFPNTVKGGAMLSQTSVTINGLVGGMTGNPTFPVATVMNPKTEAWAVLCRLQIISLSANTRIWMGLTETSRATLNGLQVVGTGAGTGTLNLYANGNLTATSWPMDTTAMHDFLVTYDATTMTCYVDGVSRGSAANSANVNTPAMAAGFQVFNNGVATNESVNFSRLFHAFQGA